MQRCRGVAGRPVAVLEEADRGQRPVAPIGAAGAPTPSAWRGSARTCCADRSRCTVVQLDAGVAARSCCRHRVVHRQIDDHGVARRRDFRKRHRAHEHARRSSRRQPGRSRRLAERRDGIRARPFVREEPCEAVAAESTRECSVGGSTCAHGPAGSIARAWPRGAALAPSPRSHGAIRSARPRCDAPGNSLRRPPRCRASSDPDDVAAAGALDLRRAVVGAIDLARSLSVPQPALHQIRAEVREQQQPAEQEERDDQDRRNEPDEDVGDDQLAADAPEQAALCDERQAADDEVRRRRPRSTIDATVSTTLRDAERHARRPSRRRRTRRGLDGSAD